MRFHVVHEHTHGDTLSQLIDGFVWHWRGGARHWRNWILPEGQNGRGDFVRCKFWLDSRHGGHRMLRLVGRQRDLTRFTALDGFNKWAL
jgi:hypothetical protein